VARWLRVLVLLLVLTVVGVAVGRWLQLRGRPESAAPGMPELMAKLKQPTPVVEGLQKLGEIRAMLDEAPDEAARRLRALIAASPASPEAGEARVILASLLAKEGDTAGAVEQLDAVIADPQAGPRATRARIQRARLLAATKPDEARRDLQAIVRDKRHLPAHQNQARLELGLLELREGKFLDAVATLGPLTTRDYPEKAAALDAIGKALAGHAEKLAKGDNPQALLAWGDEMIKRFPELESMKGTIRYRQAGVLRQTGRLAEARLIVERLRRDDPSMADACADELARIAEAEAAAGILRSPAAFLEAKAQGKETRRHVQADIAADTTWAKADGPIVLAGAVTVKRGATLTIEPGCVVQLLVGTRLVVEGALVAAGTAEAPIRFTSAVGKSPTPFDGEGILFADSSDDERCRLEHCVVEYQRMGVTCAAASPAIRRSTLARNGVVALRASEGAAPIIEDCRIESNDAAGLSAAGASPVVRRCLVLRNGADGARFADKSGGTVASSRIRDNAGDGIACDNFASPTIEGNEIAGNKGAGIRCNRFSQPAIKGNVIRGNAGTGIRCTLSSAPTIAGNLIQGNGDQPIVMERSDPTIRGNLIIANRPYGINCKQSASPRIEGNWIERNGGVGIYCGEASAPVIAGNAIIGQRAAITNSSTNTVQAAGNYFGEVDDARMGVLIVDKGDQAALGEVVWRPRLSEPPPRPPAPKLDLPPLP